MLAQARTGTGKTAAFAIPILERLRPPATKRTAPQALVLVPTRELAVQVREEAVKLAHGRKMHIVAVYGGKPIREPDRKAPAAAPTWSSARPAACSTTWAAARCTLDGAASSSCSTRPTACSTSASGPTSNGFSAAARQSRQTLLLSATVPRRSKRLAERYMRDPEMLEFSPHESAVETIEQFYFTVDPERKFDLLVKLLEPRETPSRRSSSAAPSAAPTKSTCGWRKQLPARPASTATCSRTARDRVMAPIPRGQGPLAGGDRRGGPRHRRDAASRTSSTTTFPQFCDDYVHRVGRTGRMGREGVAYTFVTPEEGGELTRIEMRIDRLLKRDEIPGFQAFTERGPIAPLPVLGGPTADDLSSGDGVGEPAAAEPPQKKAVPPLLGRGGRPPRRIRRAL